jgi:hypothetical protein
MWTINGQSTITPSHTPSGVDFSTSDGHRSLAELGFLADSLRNRGRELVRSEANSAEAPFSQPA